MLLSQGYGSLGLFGVVSPDFLALSDPHTEVIVVALNFLQASPYPVNVIMCIVS